MPGADRYVAWCEMPYQSFSLEEFAQYIGMDLRDVRKLAERGKLPGKKIGGHWRFNRARVTEWLQQEMPSLSEERLIEIERALGSRESGSKQFDLVTSMMTVEGIDLMMRAGSAGSVMRGLVDLAEQTGLLYDKTGLLDAVTEREAMCSTAMPNGVALPHPRQPMPYASGEPIICLGRTPQGVPFGSPTGILTHLFFLICSHEYDQHLHVLARLVRILDEETVTGLRETEEAEEALALLIRREKIVAERYG